jgi:sirohydrochlorin ferrochelatase
MPRGKTTAILLVGHGSALAEAKEAFEALARMVRAGGGYETVAIAFLACGDPDLAQAVEFCVAQGASRILLCPCFMFAGAHVRQDLPAQMGAAAARHPGLEWVLGEPLGAHPKLAEAVCSRVDEALAKADWQRS